MGKTQDRDRSIRLLLAACAAGWVGSAAAATEAWPVAGRQGIIRSVIVPADLAGQREAYQPQIDSLCAGAETCFLNFYTNTTGAPLAVPLPDAIANEPTAILRRSAKQGVDGFRWSCRLKKPEPDCYQEEKQDRAPAGGDAGRRPDNRACLCPSRKTPRPAHLPCPSASCRWRPPCWPIWSSSATTA